MSEGASATPVSAPVPTGAPSAPSATETQTKPPVAPSWGEEDDKKFFELAKRSPYKAKIKGEERAIDSKDSLKELLGHAQRGIGADKVVAETKKEREAAAKEREEAKRERELFAKAKAGDFEARKMLGLVSQDEIRQRDAEWESVPKEVRELFDDRNKAHAELARLKAERAAFEQEQTTRKEQAELLAARRVAATATNDVLQVLGVTKANAERYLPHVAGAIADLAEAGLELGVDMPNELIAERVKQRLGAFDESHFEGLETKRAGAIFAARLAKMQDSELDDALPMELQKRIARKVARALVGSKKTPQAPAGAQREPERRPEPPKVLSPFRWGR